MHRFKLVSALLLSCATASALAHSHLTIDTDGSRVLIVPGLPPGDEVLTLSDTGELLVDGAPGVFSLLTPLTMGPLAGSFASENELMLTSDYFVNTGHLGTGKFLFELAGVVPLDTRSEAIVVAWGSADPDHAGVLVVPAHSDGPTRTARSFPVPANSHQHDQVVAMSRRGIARLKLVAWDSTGQFADSAPVYLILTSVVPCTPADIADAAGDAIPDGALSAGDVVLFFHSFFAPCTNSGESCNPADIADTAGDSAPDGRLTASDVVVFFGSFFSGC